MNNGTLGSIASPNTIYKQMENEQVSLSNSGFSQKSRRRSLTQFIPKNNVIYNPYNNSNDISSNTSRSESPNELPKISTSSSTMSPRNNNRINNTNNRNTNRNNNRNNYRNNRYNIRKPNIYVKRRQDNNNNNNYKNTNGYYTSPEYETEIDTETETETDSEISHINGYLSDGSALKKKKHKTKKIKHKSFKRSFLPPNNNKLTNNLSSIEKQKQKQNITTINKYKKKKKKKKYRNDPDKKRHSVGHCDSSKLGILKSKYYESEKKNKTKKHSSKQLKELRWQHRATSIESNIDSQIKNSKKKKSGRRRSIFNQNENVKLVNGEHNNNNKVKKDNNKIFNIETEQEFYTKLMNDDDYSKEDIIELCWDLLRSKDRSDELLQMICLMNSDLSYISAYNTMMNTIKQTLNCKFTSLYYIESESLYLKCIWTSAGEPHKDIYISTTSSTQLAARVYQKNSSIIRSLNTLNAEICPEYDGFGNVYILGQPIFDMKKIKIGVLMLYRDRSKSLQFDEKDLYSAKILTSICSNTLNNISLFNQANEKEKQSQKILSIIDEMSGDVSQGYTKIIRKLVRKIRSLVVCTYIDFWIVDFVSNKLKCEVSHNNILQDLIIDKNSTNIIGQCAINGKYIKIDNSRMDKRYSKQQLEYCQGQSILVIPVRVENEIEPIAVIVAINKLATSNNHNHTNNTCSNISIPFTNKDRRMLETFATSSSILIKNSLLFQKINGLNRKHESMVSILRALQEKHDVTHMLSEATLAVREALEAERVSLWFEDGQGNLDSLDIGDTNIGHDDSNIELQNSIQSVFIAIARYCVEDKMLINTPNVFEDEELWNSITDFIEFKDITNLNNNQWFLHRPCSVLCVPILSNDSVVGVIQAIYKKGTIFTDTDQQIVESVSSEVAHTIARNISDLTLQKYVEKHDDIPLDVIEYYLTGGMVDNDQQIEMEIEIEMKEDDIIIIEQDEAINSYYISNILDDKLKSYCAILTTCDFDVTQFDIQQDLEQFILYSINEYGLIDEFKLNISKLKKFIHSIAKLYRTNPFHNWQHGFFVFHFVLYFITKQNNITNILTHKQILAILIAGMCHDVDHPGNDNLYEIESDSDLARIYNGLSVLENHHTYTTLALLRKNELNFFIGSNLNNKEIKEIKKIITKSIMSTDMSHHNESIGILNDFITEKKININKSMDEYYKNNKNIKINEINNIKLKICQSIVHLGDLSAQTYPWRIAKEWERRIAKEFKQQTIKEKKLDIPVRDWMAKTDLTTRYKNQFFFVTHVVKPLWEPAASLFPEMEERLTTLKANSQKYIEIAKKKEKD